MGDGIDRSEWTEADHRAEELAKDLAGITTSDSAEPRSVEGVKAVTTSHPMLIIGTLVAIFFMVLVLALLSRDESPSTDTTSSEGSASAQPLGQGTTGTEREADEDSRQDGPEPQVDPGAAPGAPGEGITYSRLHLYLDPETERGLPTLAPAELAKDTVNIDFRWDAMVVEGDFDLTYECDEVEVCWAPDARMDGAASGTFVVDLILPPQSEDPPPGWPGPTDRWTPKTYDGWFGYGPLTVDLAADGNISHVSATLDGHTSHDYRAFHESAGVDAFVTVEVWPGTTAGDGSLSNWQYTIYIGFEDDGVPDLTWTWSLSVSGPLG